MPDQQAATFDPVADFHKAWPNANLPEVTIRQNLQDPAKFRAAFPQYSGVSDDDVKKNMAKYAPTSAENSVEKGSTWKPNAGFTPSNMAGQAWEGLKQMGSAALSAGKDALDPRIPVIEGPNSLLHKYITAPAEVEQHKARTATTPLESFGHSVAEAIPVIGPWAASLGEQAGTGDVGGALSKGATQVAAAEAIPRVGEAARATREFVGEKIHTPEGELKPIAKKAAQSAGVLAGGAAGGATTIPGAGLGGAYLGREYGPSLLNKAFPKPMPPEMPVISPAPFELTSPPAERETPIQDTLHFPKPAEPPTIGPLEPPQRPSMSKLQDVIAHEGVGAPRLQPNVPIGQQLRSVGAAAAIPERMPTIGRPPVTLPARQIGNTVAPELTEEFGPVSAAPGKLPATFTEAVGEATGAESTPEEAEKARLQRQYPDRGERQQVHIVGEDFYEAAKHDPELVKEGTKLTGPDVRHAAINLGEDMGQISVGNRIKTGNQISPQELLGNLIKKGHTPRAIIEAAKRPVS